MSKKQQSVERELLGSLLDDQGQDRELKVQPQNNSQKRCFSYSAPPAFFDFGLKIDQKFLDDEEFDIPESNPINLSNHFDTQHNKKEKNQQPLSHPPNFRKLSYQPKHIHPFQLYQPPTMNLPYYPVTSIQTQEEGTLNLGEIGQWAKDQNGSRTVQNLLQNGTDQNKNAIFQSIYNEGISLITDKFGNYVFQKIFEKGLEIHKIQLFCLLEGKMVEFSLHPYGCRVIQKAIQYISSRAQPQISFLTQISPRYLELIKNQNGNHVIQKCFDCFSSASISSIAQILIQNLEELAFHAFGCRVIQKYLQTHRKTEQCEYILRQLLELAIPLSQCQYGNYVMQHIVTKCKEENDTVLQIFLHNIEVLSTNKYASNVVEKAIQSSDEIFRGKLIDYLINSQQKLIKLAKHQFGNYVVQSLVDRSVGEKKSILKAQLKANKSEIENSQYGRHVLMQLEKSKIK